MNNVSIDNQNNLPYELDSNRSSVLFERSKTHRGDKGQESESKESTSKYYNNNSSINDHIKITSLKTLLRLFRINLVSTT